MKEIGPEDTHAHTHTPGMRRRDTWGENQGTEKQHITHEHANAPNCLYTSLTGPKDPVLDLPVFPLAYAPLKEQARNPGHSNATATLSSSSSNPPSTGMSTAPKPQPKAVEETLPKAVAATIPTAPALNPDTTGVRAQRRPTFR